MPRRDSQIDQAGEKTLPLFFFLIPPAAPEQEAFVMDITFMDSARSLCLT